MSDPIGALALRNIQGFQGINDGPKSISIDIGKGDGPSFGDTLKKAVGEVSNAQDNATDHMQRFMRGEPVELPAQPAALRRRQHAVAERFGIQSVSRGREPYRRVVLLPGSA